MFMPWRGRQAVCAVYPGAGLIQGVLTIRNAMRATPVFYVTLNLKFHTGHTAKMPADRGV
jgi:hypothetical protein